MTRRRRPTGSCRAWPKAASIRALSTGQPTKRKNSSAERGLRCWIAPRDLRPGVEYGEEIVNGIRDSRCLVLVLSEAANASPMVRREVERAVSYGKPVFPVRIEEVLPARSLEFFVSATQWIDAWSGSLTERMMFLADSLTDDRKITEIEQDLRKRTRRQHVPKWIAAAALVVAAAVAGAYLLINRPATGAATATAAGGEWMATVARDAGLDLATLDADDFQVRVTRSLTLGADTATLEIQAPAALDAIVARGALEYRIGSRPWKSASINPLSGQPIAMLDARDMEANGPVQLRLDGQPATLAGPFIGPFEYAIGVRTALAESARERALSDTRWLTPVAGTWSIDSQFIEETAGVVRAVRVGAAQNALSLRTVLPQPPGANPSPQEIANYKVSINSLLLAEVLRLGLRDTLYGQVELFDGTLGPVVEFRTNARTTTVSAPPANSGGAGTATPPAAFPRGVSGAGSIPVPGVVAPPAAPRTLDINGTWVFRQPIPGEREWTFTITGYTPGDPRSAIQVRGEGMEGTGTFNGMFGSFNIAADPRTVGQGTFTVSAGGLVMYVSTRQRDRMPSGTFTGSRQ